MSENQVIITPDGFELSSYSKHFLTMLGSKIYLRHVGYSNQRNIQLCIKNTPKLLQICIDKQLKCYQKKLVDGTHLKDSSISLDIYLSKLFFRDSGGYTLFIDLKGTENIFAIKNILCSSL